MVGRTEILLAGGFPWCLPRILKASGGLFETGISGVTWQPLLWGYGVRGLLPYPHTFTLIIPSLSFKPSSLLSMTYCSSLAQFSVYSGLLPMTARVID